MTAAAIAVAGVLVVVGLVLRTAAQPVTHVDLVDLAMTALQAPTGRHHAGLTGEWRPAHRVDLGPAYNGRHYAAAIAKTLRRPRPARNLIEDTTMLTTDELAGVLAGR